MRFARHFLSLVLTLGFATGCAAATQTGAAPQASVSATGETAPTSSAPTEHSQTDPPAVSAPITPSALATNPAASAAWVALMSEEGEYAASAMYQAVIDRYGPVEPYVTIKAAEDRHVAALIRQLDRLGVAAPANPYVGKVAAPASLKEAASAWAEGEVANVALYDDLLAQVSADTRLRTVLSNLRRASLEQHLPLFRQAAAADGTLSPEEMSRHASAP